MYIRIPSAAWLNWFCCLDSQVRINVSARLLSFWRGGSGAEIHAASWQNQFLVAVGLWSLFICAESQSGASINPLVDLLHCPLHSQTSKTSSFSHFKSPRLCLLLYLSPASSRRAFSVFKDSPWLDWAHHSNTRSSSYFKVHNLNYVYYILIIFYLTYLIVLYLLSFDVTYSQILEYLDMGIFEGPSSFYTLPHEMIGLLTQNSHWSDSFCKNTYLLQGQILAVSPALARKEVDTILGKINFHQACHCVYTRDSIYLSWPVWGTWY